MLRYGTRDIAALLKAMAESPQSDTLDWELCQIVENEQSSLKQYSGPLTELIVSRMQLLASLSETNNCQIFHCLLRHVDFMHIDVEMSCTKLRRQTILEAQREPTKLYELTALMFSLSVQCYKNEYVYYREADEIAIIDKLEEEIEGISTDKENTAQVIVPLLAVLMYRSPLDIGVINEHMISNLRSIHPDLAEFLTTIITNHNRELELSALFASEANLGDETSLKVAEMYEENPYPRWTQVIGCTNPDKIPLDVLIGIVQSPVYKRIIPSIKSILIAGCGTGQHPIQVAIDFPWIKITAVDISCRSLAYAKIMANKYNVNNIEFIHCDILNLPDCDKQFDMVDCVGVIHHMHNPEAGLCALLTKLRPGGLLRLAVYSRRARKAIIKFREENKLSLSRMDSEKIRQVRWDIMKQSNKGYYKDILRFYDFYTLSGCRDLIFHEQETQFSIPELQGLLKKHNLSFLGPGINNKKLNITLKKLYGSSANPYDLTSWDNAEIDSPEIFAGMYNILAQLHDEPSTEEKM